MKEDQKFYKKRFLEFWFVHFSIFCKALTFLKVSQQKYCQSEAGWVYLTKEIVSAEMSKDSNKIFEESLYVSPIKSFGWQLTNSKYWNNELVTIIIIIIKNAAICTMGNCLISSVQYWTINNVLWDILNNQIFCSIFTLH